jgi:hypothetical protein
MQLQVSGSGGGVKVDRPVAGAGFAAAAWSCSRSMRTTVAGDWVPAFLLALGDDEA